jgi:hypothetical protein
MVCFKEHSYNINMKTIEVNDEEFVLIEQISKEFCTSPAVVVKALLAAGECHTVDDAIAFYKDLN